MNNRTIIKSTITDNISIKHSDRLLSTDTPLDLSEYSKVLLQVVYDHNSAPSLNAGMLIRSSLIKDNVAVSPSTTGTTKYNEHCMLFEIAKDKIDTLVSNNRFTEIEEVDDCLIFTIEAEATHHYNSDSWSSEHTQPEPYHYIPSEPEEHYDDSMED